MSKVKVAARCRCDVGIGVGVASLELGPSGRPEDLVSPSGRPQDDRRSTFAVGLAEF